MLHPVIGQKQIGLGPGDGGVFGRRIVAPAIAGGQVNDQFVILVTNAVNDFPVKSRLHGRQFSLGVAHVNMHDGGPRLCGCQRISCNFRGRDGQICVLRSR